MCKTQAVSSCQPWVRETRFGRWFLSTEIWRRYVLAEAILDLNGILGVERPAISRLLDAGCGVGLAIPLLEEHFQPNVIVAVDIDKEMTGIAATTARNCRCKVVLRTVSMLELDFPDHSFDMIFCHQLLHHISDQEDVLRLFYRLLVPGGVALIGESCRPFIRSLPVRLLFKHPMTAQRTAAQYVDLTRSVGFEVGVQDVKMSSPWWSRWDMGLLKRLGVAGEEPAARAAEVLIVARKTAGDA
jgi:SAM-dependent methyltransferase